MRNVCRSGERSKYGIYHNKACMGAEGAEGLALLDQRLKSIGYVIDKGRGDYK